MILFNCYSFHIENSTSQIQITLLVTVCVEHWAYNRQTCSLKFLFKREIEQLSKICSSF